MIATGLSLLISVQLTAEVRDHLGSPTLFVNGQPRAPLMFFGWAGNEGPKPVRLTPEWQRYAMTFTVPEDNDGHFGVQFRVGGGPPGTVWVDDARVYPGEERDDADAQPNLLRQGGFEGPLENVAAAWSLFTRPQDGADVSYDIDATTAVDGDQSLRIDIRGGGGDFMHAHFHQSGMSARKGDVFTYSLWMKSTEDRVVDFMALHQGPPWRIYSRQGNDDYESQVRLAAAAGVHIHSFGIPMPWPAPGEEPDFSLVDDAIETTLRVDPEGLLLPRFGMAPPERWHEQNPGNGMVFSDGEETSWCVASEAWRRDFPEHLAALVRYCEAKYGDHMLGYHPCGQHTGEWFYERSWEPVTSDFSPAMEDGFRAWLTRLYGTDAALQQAWGEPAARLDTAQIPTAEEQTQGAFGLFRDPVGERRIIDYFDFKQDAMVEPLMTMARVVKEACGGAKLVTLFYGYTFDMHGIPLGPQHSGHLAMHRLIQCDDVDILVSPISYNDRELGGAGMFMCAVDSVRAAGKLWLNEDDTRTYLTPEDSGYGRVDTPEGTRFVHQRNFGQLLPRRLACWYMDLGGVGWLNGEDIWQNIAELRRLYEGALDEPASWRPEVVVVVDERAPLYTSAGRALHSPIVYEMRSQLFRMGMPFEIRLLSDLTAGRVPPAKAYVFLNAFRLTRAEREAIRRQTDGSCAVWLYAGGLLDEGPAPDVALGERVETMNSLTELPLMRASDHAGRLVAADGEEYGTDLVLSPRLALEETDGLTVLGRYADGQIGAGLLETAGGLRAYIGAVHCPASLLRGILAQAGVHVWCDADDVVLTDGRFLCVSATTEGAKELALPSPRRIVDALSGEVVADEVEGLSLELSLGETRLLWLEAP